MDETQIAAILSAFDTKLATDPQIRAILRKITGGKATFADTADYAIRAGNLLGQFLSGEILDIAQEDREVLCAALLKNRYTDLNKLLGTVQRAQDKPLGISLNPIKAPFPAERVQQVAHSLLDPGVKPEVIRRRANAPVATVAKSFHDDYIRINAQKRQDLGFKCYLNRVAVNGCCSWCTEVAGRYVYGDHPADIFRRHDNCDCTVTFENGRQRQDVWSKRTWDADPKEVEANGFEPTVLPQDAAESLQNAALGRLTLGGRRDIMRVSGAVSGALNPYSEQADKHAERYYAAVRKMTTDVRRISENTGYSEELIQSIKDFVFNEKHDLGDRFDYFDPDYKMAQSWQRLIDGKNIQEHDLTLLKHEQMERELMRQGYTQSEAHLITSQKYNYDKEAKAYYDRNEKHSKE